MLVGTQSTSNVNPAHKTEESKKAPVFASSIPVVDMSKFDNTSEFLTQFDNALQKGFFAITFPEDEMNLEAFKSGYNAFIEFFSSTLEQKMSIYHPESNGQRGFVSGIEKNGEKADPKGFVHCGKKNNHWPVHMNLEGPAMGLYHELDRLAQPILKSIALALGQREDHFTGMTENAEKLMRAIHYYPNPKEGIWAAEHRDTGFLTILPYASAKGLEVEINGEWIPVLVPKNALVCNVADFLEVFSNGRYPSCNHRVRCTEPDSVRYSIVFFIHPTGDTMVAPLGDAPPKFPAATRDEQLHLRLGVIGLKPIDESITEGRFIKGIEEMVKAGTAADTVKRWYADYQKALSAVK